jgi:hypothetical protein
LDEAKQKEVIAYIDAMELYREMISELDQRQFEKIWDEVKLQYTIQQNRSELKSFLIKLGEAYFEKKIKRLLDANEDGKLIEGHVGRPHTNPVS